MINIFEKIKSAFSREIIIKYQAGSGISAQPRNYGSGAKFPGGLSRGGGNAPIIILNHSSLRQQVRDKMYDSMEGRALIKSIVDTVVDTGRTLKPTPISSILGITPEKTEEWAEDVAEKYHLWAKSKKSNRSRINNHYQDQRLYQFFQQRDNDIFVRFFYGRDKDLINPLQISFLDPNQIRGNSYTSTFMQLPGDDGITRDDAGRETHYKIWYFDKNTSTYKNKIVPAIGEKSKRLMMLHGYNPEYAGQGRGFPPLSHAIQELADLTNFKLSTIQKAINQASFVGAVENDQQDASQPLEGRIAGPIKEYGSYPTPSEEAEGVTVKSTEPIINWNVMPEATIRQPGSVLVGNLRRGDKMKYLQDTSPAQSYDAFVNSFFSSICASVGWSMEVVLKKFSNNYSASRGTLILCWRSAQIEANEMAADFLDPIYKTWLSEEIAGGRISAPGWSDFRLRAAWLSCEWAGAPMPNIDPLKTANADRAYVELGAQTLDDVARNLNGSSGKANRSKNARQFAELPSPPWNAVEIENKDDEDDEDDEDDKDDK